MRLIIFSLFTTFISVLVSNAIYSQTVDASIEISEKNQGRITIKFERENVDNEKFFITSLNLLNNTSHEIPLEYDENNELTFLTGSWYNKKNDLFIGTNLMIGHNSGQVKLILPSAVYAGQNNQYALSVEKPDADFKSIIHSDENLEYIDTKNLQIKFEDPNVKVLSKSESFKFNGINTYNIDFIKHKSGYINYTYISFWYIFLKNIWFFVAFIVPLYLIRDMIEGKEIKVKGRDKLIKKEHVTWAYLLFAIFPLIISSWLFYNYGLYDQLTIIFILLLISFPLSLFIPLGYSPYIRNLKK